MIKISRARCAAQLRGDPEVNEMLQGMERHHGVFICTPHWPDSLDADALRRFTFKIEFLPLTATQRAQMFSVEALSGNPGLLDGAMVRRLDQLTQLCPCNFAAVKRQINLLAAELSADEFLTQLQTKYRLKPGVRQLRSIGFVP